MSHDTLAILDFGGQYAHLIANRVRRLGVYSEIRSPSTPAEELKAYKGLILSGGPMSVYADHAPHCDKKIFELGLPILGICYGHQLMQYLLGGEVMSGQTKEYGPAQLNLLQPVGLFGGLKSAGRVWMSHGDTVATPAKGFVEAGRTEDCPYSALFDPMRHFYGVQFHPEVTHTEEGMKMLDNFLQICRVSRDWNLEQFLQEEMKVIQEKVGNRKVFMLVSGGVDSTVAFALLAKTLGEDRVYGLFIDTGLLRQGEREQVQEALTKAGLTRLHIADKSQKFLSALKGVTDPEKKRTIIGELFWSAKEEIARELNLNADDWVMGQGTIYPDTIETGGTRYADRIKTHHNRVDLVQKMIKEGRVIEPLAQLYKDEVRQLGEKLGLPHSLVWRQPFPGPGLGVRILCVDTASAKEQPHFDILSQNIQIYLKSHTVFSDVSASVLPIQSVGVQGDERTYRHPAALFTGRRDWELLDEASTAVTNRFFEVNRVILALSGEFSSDFRVKVCDLSPDRVALLQKIDHEVKRLMAPFMEEFQIWQFPVILAPVSPIDAKESVVLRPIVSTEAMTANFARVRWELLDSITQKIMTFPEISHVFYDLTNKPPGTIEWE